ncbi:signal peptide peptidase SppA [Mannheimia granulomatis]|uniref:Signal peptide peptidase SppA n=1 Tax=Mannheimia granulomatis TaxID=85402 RepID=A0A6G8JFQ8_9PAST|nr:signal peptide peptidase SppA [Mannheimia granulomatis]QIM65906.1 signal peptide peptidase SppA [Mannheimia granulomatis]
MFKVFNIFYRIFRCIRECVINLFFVLFILMLIPIFAFISEGTQSTKPIFTQGALRLNLDGYLADNREQFADFYRLIQSELGDSKSLKISTFDVVQAIRQAKDDPKITGLVLDLSALQNADFSSLDFVGNEIKHFRTSGKPVIAVGEQYSQKQYYLASFADEIYLNKAGTVELKGLSYTNTYFKALLNKIEAEPHIFRVGTYKSAVEPFIRDDMSPEAKQNAEGWLKDTWHKAVTTIAENRNITPQEIDLTPEVYIEKYKQAKGNDAEFALKQKWVTKLVSNHESQSMLISLFGKNSENSYNHVEFSDYLYELNDRFNNINKPKIAVINVEGEIMDGESDESSVGSETVVKLLQKAREDSNVQGLLLRINSPGGSAMASEIIRQEVEEFQKAGKPVVASMGDIAASGGYWIAATSDKIIASPNTLTGSIGIFGLAVTFEKTAKKFGVTEDGIATSALAQKVGLKTLPKEQGEVLQIGIENGYERFLELVARGRKMSKEAVDKVAQGQVWSGNEALKHGLVDELGDFNTAYSTLSTLINQKRQTENQPEIEQLDLQWFVEEDNSLLGTLARDFKTQLQVKLVSWLDLPWLKKSAQQVDILSRFNDPKQMYLYCLNCGKID